MPFISKRRAQAVQAIGRRWSNKCEMEFEMINGIDVPMDSIDHQNEEEKVDDDDEKYEKEEDYDDDEYEKEEDEEDEEDEVIGRWNYRDMISIFDIADLYELIKSECDSRYLSVLVYMTLRFFKVPYSDSCDFLKSIGALTLKRARHWSRSFIEGHLDDFVIDGRGGKHTDSFYDVYPELETDAKSFAVVQCGQKNAAFTVADLASYVDKRFYEINNMIKSDSCLVRSVESCRLDLRRWGACFENNTNRPYFEGHDRPDVLACRQEFLNHFLSNKDSYYTVTEDSDPQWKTPTTSSPTVLICKTEILNYLYSFNYFFPVHDESTFRSGDMRNKRWLINDSVPFFNKGHGRSVMVSDFLVQHPSGEFFQLNENEWTNAVQTHPDLLNDNDLRYIKNSATVAAHLGVDPYFDNNIILLQFERLFKLLQFKEAYRNHILEVVVDNARTHTMKEFSINDFGKGIDTRCPVSSVEFTDKFNNIQTFHFYFQSGPHKDKSKGLLAIAEELGYQVSKKTTLDQLKSILSTHSIFQNV